MAKKKTVTVALHCADCNRMNYTVRRTTRAQKEGKLEVKKYCNQCQSHTVHKEKKISKPQ